MGWSIHTLQQMAIAISTISIVFNGAEGAVSIYFGDEGSSIALLAFGIQSLVEIVSAALVLWRFCYIALPGNESKDVSTEKIRKERVATIGVGMLLGLLTIGTIVSSLYNIVKHQHPETADYNLIISGAALFFMIIIWAPKPWLARELNSSAMAGEAMCSLSCMAMMVSLVNSLRTAQLDSVQRCSRQTAAVLSRGFRCSESFARQIQDRFIKRRPPDRDRQRGTVGSHRSGNWPKLLWTYHSIFFH
jgi:divalent metal cation (Fe/Co/Zn/Cd) transporter